MSAMPMRFGAIMFILMLALVVSACSTANGDASPSSPASPKVSERPEPSPPEPEPSTTPLPSVTPSPSEKPIEVVRIEMPSIGRVTADDVGVRVLPGTNQPLVQADGPNGETVAGLRLSSGDSVSIAWGPVYVDGHTWYAVQPGTGEVTWGEGWIAADYLVADEPVGLYPLARADGFGSGGAISTDVTERSAVNVSAVVTPMPGAESCEAELVVLGTNGVATTVTALTATETLRLFGSPLENPDLYQQTAGEITLQMRTDCSWAAIAFVPQG